MQGDTFKAKDLYDKLINIFSNTEKHAPSQSKIIRRNRTPFMNKELRKAIMQKCGNLKYSTRENILPSKNKNKCNNLVKKYY